MQLIDAGIDPSAGITRDSYDNALAVSITGLSKTEIITRRRRRKSLESLEFASLEWVNWFNRRRLSKPLGHDPLAEFGRAYYDGGGCSARVAGLMQHGLRETRGGSVNELAAVWVPLRSQRLYRILSDRSSR